MNKVQVQCVECGKEFEAWPSSKRKFCSVACRVAAQTRAQQTGRQMLPTKPRRGDEIACRVCGKLFYRSPGEIRRNRDLCSVACLNEAQRKPPVIKTCGWCGKELVLKPSQAGTQYCSKACEAEARITRPLDRMHNGRRAKLDDAGYVMVWEPEHPNKSHRGWQYEHRLVAEQALGRYLESYEQVHHVNHDTSDNRPENLEVMHENDHAVLSVQEYLARVQRERAELAEYRRRFGPLDGG